MVNFASIFGTAESERHQRDRTGQAATSFHEISYKRHADHADVARPFRDGEKTFDHIFDAAYVSAHMHERTIRRLLPLLNHFPGAEWLTVGDDSWGRDAYFLRKNGATALASGLSRELADIAIHAGHTSEFAVENAEALSSPNESFDFVLCKHAFHHFPRPFVAFHEMLRVARKGIVLIEPAESGANHYEPAGNYLYRVCVREIEKAARGVNLPGLAIGWDNSLVPPNMGSARIDDLGEEWKSTIGELEKVDSLCRSLGNLQEFFSPIYLSSLTGISHRACIGWLRHIAKRLFSCSGWHRQVDFNYPRNVVIAIFKQPLGENLKSKLSAGDFTIVDLEPNPYVGPEGWGPPL